MNVLILSDRYPQFGASGAGQITHQLAKAYRRAGDEVHVLTTSRNEQKRLGSITTTTVHDIRVNAVQTFHLPRLRNYSCLVNPVTSKAINEWFQHETADFDAVHVHNVHEFLSYDVLRVISNHVNGPCVLTYHDGMSFAFGKIDHFVDGDPSEDGHPPMAEYRMGLRAQIRQARKRYNPFRNPITRRYLRKYVDQAVSVSRELGRALRANRIPLDGYIHNGANVKKYGDADPTKFNEEYSLCDRDFVLFGGRVSDKKGGRQLAAALEETRTNLDLVITGESEAYVQSLKSDFPSLSDRIVGAGWVDDSLMPSAFRAAQVVAVPSIYLDPLPTVAIEAQAAGTPVAATCYGGAKETVVADETGKIVNPFDTSRFAAALDTLATTDMSRKCREHVRNVFDIDDKALEYRRLLDGAASHP